MEIKGTTPDLAILDELGNQPNIGRTMELTFEDMVNAEEQQKADQAELNKHAAKQLMIELMMIKKRIYESGTLVNSVLIVQIKQILRGLMRKYNDAGMLVGENVTLVLSDKTERASIRFAYSPGLQMLVRQVEENLKGDKTE